MALRNFKTFIDSTEIPAALVLEYSLISDIESLYSGGAIILSDDEGTFLDSSIVRIGSDIILQFTLDSNRIINYKGVVVSIEGDPEESKTYDSMGGAYVIKFLHTSYFNQNLESRGFFDKTSSIISSELSRLSVYFTNINIEESDDLKVRRYMINQKPLEFVADIAHTTTINGSAAVCFIDDLGRFNFKALNAMFTQIPTVSIAPAQSTAVPSYRNILLLSRANLYKFKSIENIKTLKLKANKLNLETNQVESTVLRTPRNGRIIANRNKIDNLESTGVIHEHTSGIIEQNANIQNYLKTQMFNYDIDVATDDAVGILKAGDLVELCIGSKLIKGNNSYSGNYLIKRIEHSMDDGNVITNLRLIRPTLNRYSTQTGALYDL